MCHRLLVSARFLGAGGVSMRPLSKVRQQLYCIQLPVRSFGADMFKDREQGEEAM